MDNQRVRRDGQREFWQSMINKYEQRNARLLQEQSGVKQRLRTMENTMRTCMCYNVKQGKTPKFQRKQQECDSSAEDSLRSGCDCDNRPVKDVQTTSASIIGCEEPAYFTNIKKIDENISVCDCSTNSCFLPGHSSAGKQTPLQNLCMDLNNCNCHHCPLETSSLSAANSNQYRDRKNSICSCFDAPVEDSGESVCVCVSPEGIFNDNCTCSFTSKKSSNNSDCECTSFELPQFASPATNPYDSINLQCTCQNCPLKNNFIECKEPESMNLARSINTLQCNCKSCPFSHSPIPPPLNSKASTNKQDSSELHSDSPYLDLNNFSITEEDIHYLEKVKLLFENEKMLKKEVEDLAHTEKTFQECLQQCQTGTDSQTIGGGDYEKENLRRLNKKLEESNRELELEIEQISGNLKKTKETVEEPIKREIEEGKRKISELENKLRQCACDTESQKIADERELDFVQNQLQNAKQHMEDLNLVNERLKEELCLLNCRANELQTDIINQKLSEIHTLSRLSAQKKQLSESRKLSRSSGSKSSETNGGGGGSDDLNVIARNLSNLLHEANDCNKCQKTHPDLIDTVKYIKNLVDMVNTPTVDERKSNLGDICSCMDRLPETKEIYSPQKIRSSESTIGPEGDKEGSGELDFTTAIKESEELLYVEVGIHVERDIVSPYEVTPIHEEQTIEYKETLRKISSAEGWQEKDTPEYEPLEKSHMLQQQQATEEIYPEQLPPKSDMLPQEEGTSQKLTSEGVIPEKLVENITQSRSEQENIPGVGSKVEKVDIELEPIPNEGTIPDATLATKIEEQQVAQEKTTSMKSASEEMQKDIDLKEIIIGIIAEVATEEATTEEPTTIEEYTSEVPTAEITTEETLQKDTVTPQVTEKTTEKDLLLEGLVREGVVPEPAIFELAKPVEETQGEGVLAEEPAVQPKLDRSSKELVDEIVRKICKCLIGDERLKPCVCPIDPSRKQKKDKKAESLPELHGEEAAASVQEVKSDILGGDVPTAEMEARERIPTDLIFAADGSKFSKESSKAAIPSIQPSDHSILTKEVEMPADTSRRYKSVDQMQDMQEGDGVVKLASAPAGVDGSPITLEKMPADAERPTEVTTETRLDVPVDNEVKLVRTSQDGEYITTAVTGSGVLEVTTEGPAGVIETTLKVTGSGNIEVVTDVTEFEGGKKKDTSVIDTERPEDIAGEAATKPPIESTSAAERMFEKDVGKEFLPGESASEGISEKSLDEKRTTITEGVTDEDLTEGFTGETTVEEGVTEEATPGPGMEATSAAEGVFDKGVGKQVLTEEGTTESISEEVLDGERTTAAKEVTEVGIIEGVTREGVTEVGITEEAISGEYPSQEVTTEKDTVEKPFSEETALEEGFIEEGLDQERFVEGTIGKEGSIDRSIVAEATPTEHFVETAAEDAIERDIVKKVDVGSRLSEESVTKERIAEEKKKGILEEVISAEDTLPSIKHKIDGKDIPTEMGEELTAKEQERKELLEEEISGGVEGEGGIERKGAEDQAMMEAEHEVGVERKGAEDQDMVGAVGEVGIERKEAEDEDMMRAEDEVGLEPKGAEDQDMVGAVGEVRIERKEGEEEGMMRAKDEGLVRAEDEVGIERKEAEDQDMVGAVGEVGTERKEAEGEGMVRAEDEVGIERKGAEDQDMVGAVGEVGIERKGVEDEDMVGAVAEVGIERKGVEDQDMVGAVGEIGIESKEAEDEGIVRAEDEVGIERKGAEDQDMVGAVGEVGIERKGAEDQDMVGAVGEGGIERKGAEDQDMVGALDEVGIERKGAEGQDMVGVVGEVGIERKEAEVEGMVQAEDEVGIERKGAEDQDMVGAVSEVGIERKGAEDQAMVGAVGEVGIERKGAEDQDMVGAVDEGGIERKGAEDQDMVGAVAEVAIERKGAEDQEMVGAVGEVGIERKGAEDQDMMGAVGEVGIERKGAEDQDMVGAIGEGAIEPKRAEDQDMIGAEDEVGIERKGVEDQDMVGAVGEVGMERKRAEDQGMMGAVGEVGIERKGAEDQGIMGAIGEGGIERKGAEDQAIVGAEEEVGMERKGAEDQDMVGAVGEVGIERKGVEAQDMVGAVGEGGIERKGAEDQDMMGAVREVGIERKEAEYEGIVLAEDEVGIERKEAEDQDMVGAEGEVGVVHEGEEGAEMLPPIPEMEVFPEEGRPLKIDETGEHAPMEGEVDYGKAEIESVSCSCTSVDESQISDQILTSAEVRSITCSCKSFEESRLIPEEIIKISSSVSCSCQGDEKNQILQKISCATSLKHETKSISCSCILDEESRTERETFMEERAEVQSIVCSCTIDEDGRAERETFMEALEKAEIQSVTCSCAIDEEGRAEQETFMEASKKAELQSVTCSCIIEVESREDRETFVEASERAELQSITCSCTMDEDGRIDRETFMEAPEKAEIFSVTCSCTIDEESRIDRETFMEAAEKTEIESLACSCELDLNAPPVTTGVGDKENIQLSTADLKMRKTAVVATTTSSKVSICTPAICATTGPIKDIEWICEGQKSRRKTICKECSREPRITRGKPYRDTCGIQTCKQYRNFDSDSSDECICYVCKESKSASRKRKVSSRSRGVCVDTCENKSIQQNYYELEEKRDRLEKKPHKTPEKITCLNETVVNVYVKKPTNKNSIEEFSQTKRKQKSKETNTPKSNVCQTEISVNINNSKRTTATAIPVSVTSKNTTTNTPKERIICATLCSKGKAGMKATSTATPQLLSHKCLPCDQIVSNKPVCAASEWTAINSKRDRTCVSKGVQSKLRTNTLNSTSRPSNVESCTISTCYKKHSFYDSESILGVDEVEILSRTDTYDDKTCNNLTCLACNKPSGSTLNSFDETCFSSKSLPMNASSILSTCMQKDGDAICDFEESSRTSDNIFSTSTYSISAACTPKTCKSTNQQMSPLQELQTSASNGPCTPGTCSKFRLSAGSSEVVKTQKAGSGITSSMSAHSMHGSCSPRTCQFAYEQKKRELTESQTTISETSCTPHNCDKLRESPVESFIIQHAAIPTSIPYTPFNARSAGKEVITKIYVPSKESFASSSERSSASTISSCTPSVCGDVFTMQSHSATSALRKQKASKYPQQRKMSQNAENRAETRAIRRESYSLTREVSTEIPLVRTGYSVEKAGSQTYSFLKPDASGKTEKPSSSKYSTSLNAPEKQQKFPTSTQEAHVFPQYVPAEYSSAAQLEFAASTHEAHVLPRYVPAEYSSSARYTSNYLQPTSESVDVAVSPNSEEYPSVPAYINSPEDQVATTRPGPPSSLGDRSISDAYTYPGAPYYPEAATHSEPPLYPDTASYPTPVTYEESSPNALRPVQAAPLVAGDQEISGARSNLPLQPGASMDAPSYVGAPSYSGVPYGPHLPLNVGGLATVDTASYSGATLHSVTGNARPVPDYSIPTGTQAQIRILAESPRPDFPATPSEYSTPHTTFESSNQSHPSAVPFINAAENTALSDTIEVSDDDHTAMKGPTSVRRSPSILSYDIPSTMEDSFHPTVLTNPNVEQYNNLQEYIDVTYPASSPIQNNISIPVSGSPNTQSPLIVSMHPESPLSPQSPSYGSSLDTPLSPNTPFYSAVNPTSALSADSSNSLIPTFVSAVSHVDPAIDAEYVESMNKGQPTSETYQSQSTDFSKRSKDYVQPATHSKILLQEKVTKYNKKVTRRAINDSTSKDYSSLNHSSYQTSSKTSQNGDRNYQSKQGTPTSTPTQNASLSSHSSSSGSSCEPCGMPEQKIVEKPQKDKNDQDRSKQSDSQRKSKVAPKTFTQTTPGADPEQKISKSSSQRSSEYESSGKAPQQPNNEANRVKMKGPPDKGEPSIPLARRECRCLKCGFNTCDCGSDMPSTEVDVALRQLTVCDEVTLEISSVPPQKILEKFSDIAVVTPPIQTQLQLPQHPSGCRCDKCNCCKCVGTEEQIITSAEGFLTPGCRCTKCNLAICKCDRTTNILGETPTHTITKITGGEVQMSTHVQMKISGDQGLSQSGCRCKKCNFTICKCGDNVAVEEIQTLAVMKTIGTEDYSSPGCRCNKCNLSICKCGRDSDVLRETQIGGQIEKTPIGLPAQGCRCNKCNLTICKCGSGMGTVEQAPSSARVEANDLVRSYPPGCRCNKCNLAICSCDTSFIKLKEEQQEDIHMAGGEHPSNCTCVDCLCDPTKFKKPSITTGEAHPTDCTCIDCLCDPCTKQIESSKNETKPRLTITCTCTTCICESCQDFQTKREISEKEQSKLQKVQKIIGKDRHPDCKCDMCKCSDYVEQIKKCEKKVGDKSSCSCPKCVCDPCIDDRININKQILRHPSNCECVDCLCKPCRKNREQTPIGDGGSKQLDGPQVSRCSKCNLAICKCGVAGKDATMQPTTPPDAIVQTVVPPGCRCNKCNVSICKCDTTDATAVKEQTTMVERPHPDGCDCIDCICKPSKKRENTETEKYKEPRNVDSYKVVKNHDTDCSCVECVCAPCADKHVQHAKSVSTCRCSFCMCKECKDPKIRAVQNPPWLFSGLGKKFDLSSVKPLIDFFKRSHGPECTCTMCTCKSCERDPMKSVTIVPGSDCNCSECICTPCKLKGQLASSEAKPHKKECKCDRCKCDPCGDPVFHTKRIKRNMKTAETKLHHESGRQESLSSKITSSLPRKDFSKKHGPGCECPECVCHPCGSKLESDKCSCPVCTCGACENKGTSYTQISAPIDKSVAAQKHDPGCQCPQCLCHPCGRKDESSKCSCPVCTCSPCANQGTYPSQLSVPLEKATDNSPGENSIAKKHGAGCKCPICICNPCDKIDSSESTRKSGLECQCFACVCDPCDRKKDIKSVSPIGEQLSTIAKGHGVGCKCPTCICNPCDKIDGVEPTKKHDLECQCFTCVCDPCNKNEYLADVPTSTIAKKHSVQCKCPTCTCNPCDKIDDSERINKHGPKCQCFTCLCDPCDQSKGSRSESPTRKPNSTDVPISTIAKNHSAECKCPTCTCNPCDKSDDNELTKRHGPECQCFTCLCNPCDHNKDKRSESPTRKPNFHLPDCDCPQCQCKSCNRSSIADEAAIPKNHNSECKCSICKCNPCDDGKVVSAVHDARSSKKHGERCDCPVCICIPCSQKESSKSVSPIRGAESHNQGCDCSQCLCKPCKASLPADGGSFGKKHDSKCECSVCRCNPCDTKGGSERTSITYSPIKSLISKKHGPGCTCPDCICEPCDKTEHQLDKSLHDPSCTCVTCLCKQCDDPSKTREKPTHTLDNISALPKSRQNHPVGCLCPECVCDACKRQTNLQKPIQKSPVVQKHSTNCTCPVCLCDPCDNIEVTEVKKPINTPHGQSCTCVQCTCEPCEDNKNNSDGVRATGTLHATACTCEKCTCRPCKDVSHVMKAATKHIPHCKCPKCECFPKKERIRKHEPNCHCKLCISEPCGESNKSDKRRLFKDEPKCLECRARRSKRKEGGDKATPKVLEEHAKCDCLPACICDNCTAIKKKTTPTLLSMGDDDFKKNIKTAKQENVNRQKEVTELEAVLDQIRCACSEAEIQANRTIPPDTGLAKKASWFKKTLGGLENALTSLHQQCAVKDKMISVMAQEFYLRENVSYDQGVCSNLPMLLPPPQYEHSDSSVCINIKITNVTRISPDSLLVKWSQPSNNHVTGYELLIDNVVRSRVHSYHRTSAVVFGMECKKKMKIEVYAISQYGRCKPAAVFLYES